VKDGQRTYYDNIPDILQVGEHQFVERRVIHLWRTDMNLAWKSATNCARSYHTALLNHKEPPINWKFGFTLKTDHVYDGFVLLALLEDHRARQSTLVVPHTGNQSDRFKAAMQARNARMRLYSQPEIRHYCSKCMRTYVGVGGQGEPFLLFHETTLIEMVT
jgi:CxC5 like cysteine cluster associated with KDZ transposases